MIKDTVSPYPDDSGAVTTGTIDHHSALFDGITLFRPIHRISYERSRESENYLDSIYEVWRSQRISQPNKPQMFRGLLGGNAPVLRAHGVLWPEL